MDSETNRVGQTFRASMDQPVMVDGQTVIPRGADAWVKLVDAKDSGKLAGRAELALSLQSVSINGHMVDINTQSINKESGSQGEKTAKVAGGTAAVGAIIGAIAGGGKGAAIGAGAGAAAGAGSQVVLGGSARAHSVRNATHLRARQPDAFLMDTTHSDCYRRQPWNRPRHRNGACENSSGDRHLPRA